MCRPTGVSLSPGTSSSRTVLPKLPRCRMESLAGMCFLTPSGSWRIRQLCSSAPGCTRLLILQFSRFNIKVLFNPYTSYPEISASEYSKSQNFFKKFFRRVNTLSRLFIIACCVTPCLCAYSLVESSSKNSA